MHIKENFKIGFKYYLKLFIPPIFSLFRRKLSWRGDFKDFKTCSILGRGYDSNKIQERVKESALQVVAGKYPYERDGVLFEKIEYNYELLSSLFFIASKNKELHVIDFGGGLGSTFFQNRFLQSIYNLDWRVVEQAHFVSIGQNEIKIPGLSFHFSIENALTKGNNQVLLLSSVLQYLENPEEEIRKIVGMKLKYILIDRTSFNRYHCKTRLTLQVNHPSIQDSSYPCWFFDEVKFKELFLKEYSLMFEWNCSDCADIPSYFKGFLFVARNYE